MGACGEDDLTSDERLDLSGARGDLAILCLGYLESGTPGPDDADGGQRALDTLVSLYRDKPDAEDDGTSVKQILADAATDLEECGARTEASRLDRVLAAGP